MDKYEFEDCKWEIYLDGDHSIISNKLTELLTGMDANELIDWTLRLEPPDSDHIKGQVWMEYLLYGFHRDEYWDLISSLELPENFLTLLESIRTDSQSIFVNNLDWKLIENNYKYFTQNNFDYFNNYEWITVQNVKYYITYLNLDKIVKFNQYFDVFNLGVTLDILFGE